MEFPYYFRVGSLNLHPHFVLEALAYAIGFRVYLGLRERWGDPVGSRVRWWVIAATAAGAAVGSKVLFWFEDPGLTLTYWSNPLYLMGGKTIVGGLIGGLMAVEWAKRRLGVTKSTGDLFALPLCMGIAIGRIGCFLTGLADKTYGTTTALPWSVDFGDGVSRHPTQVYEIVFVLLLGIVLWRRSHQPHQNGDLFKFFMVGYMGFRLLVDFLKPGVALMGMTSLQWACLLMLFYYSRDLPRLFPASLGGARGFAGEKGV